jgi:hypothetical protein
MTADESADEGITTAIRPATSDDFAAIEALFRQCDAYHVQLAPHAFLVRTAPSTSARPSISLPS